MIVRKTARSNPFPPPNLQHGDSPEFVARYGMPEQLSTARPTSPQAPCEDRPPSDSVLTRRLPSPKWRPASSKEAWRLRDPVHGLVVFGGSGDCHRDETDWIAWHLLNTREFQRLRRIRQLGFSDLVFPGATHSRFAHSIGTYHVARQLVDIIARRAGVDRDRDRERIALLAALLHDIGHGPFSHAFESAATSTGLRRRHERWSSEIVEADTGVNRILREVDKDLPRAISSLLKEEEPKDIYAAVVSSQFDADRLDYVQRDRMATGVAFSRVDRDWLFDCLEVGSITIGGDSPQKVACLYLGPKGISVAEEYLEARYRLYSMVYMHKTTRAAEKMLEELLRLVAFEVKQGSSMERCPVLEFITTEGRSLSHYLDLDDAAIWSALAVLENCKHRGISDLAMRLRDRRLYKCVDIGARDRPRSNLLGRFRGKLIEQEEKLWNGLLFDTPSMTMYKWYDFEGRFALNKVLVKPRSDMEEPVDIVTESLVVKALWRDERIQRVYAPDAKKAGELQRILEEIEK